MSSHNRRAPRLPDLTPVEKMDRGLTWQQVMARAKKKLVVQPKDDSDVVSATEKSNPEKAG